MAYICERNIPCKECEHYRWDEDRERMVCFATIDEANDKAEAVREYLRQKYDV